MNEFLNKLFNLPYFGIVLFSLIGVLALIFIILLIMALKDAAKNRKMNEVEETSETPNVDMQQFENAFKTEDFGPDELVIDNSMNQVVNNDINTNTEVDENTPTVNLFDEFEPLEPYNEVNTYAPIEETPVVETHEEPVIEQPVVQEPIVMGSPIEEKKEEVVTPLVESIDLPDLLDIPTPQPVKVVSESKILDSSTPASDINVNNIENEEYELHR